MDLSNMNATQRAMQWFKKQQADQRGEQIPGVNAPAITGPTIGPYNPTARDMIANAVLPSNRAPTGPEAKLVEGLIGSRGLGTTGASAIDFVPGVGDALQASEAQSKEELALAALPFMPATGIAKPALRRQGPMELWHASPHDYDTLPSTKYINTGERTQNEGQGIYTAGSEKVADWYWKNLLSPKDIDAISAGEPHARASAYIRDWGNDIDKAKNAFFTSQQSYKNTVDKYEAILKDPNSPPHIKELAEKSIPKLRARVKDDEVIADLFNKGEAKPFENTNVKYKFEVDADPSEFVNQDKRLITKAGRPTQSATVNKKLEEAGFEPGYKDVEYKTGVKNPVITQERINFLKMPTEYSAAGAPGNVDWLNFLNTGGHERAIHGTDVAPRTVPQMNLMTKYGIPGTRYLDAFSKQQIQEGPKTQNFVIGDDERFKKILGKWKMSGLLDEEAMGNAATA